MKCMLAAVLCLLVSTACSSNKKSESSESESAEAQAEPAKSGGKTLIVYFSHAGDNYAVGNIKVGNTKIVADYIAELIDADMFEIKTSKYDGIAYKPLCDLAKKEQENGELPPYDGDIDVSQYETIFIGGPIWWGTYPQVMFTFLKKHDLSLKILVPFSTHEGSGLGNCLQDLTKLYPRATVRQGLSSYGHDAKTSKDHVEKFLKKQGYLK